MNSRRQHGQAMVEYIVVGSVLVYALFMAEVSGGRTPAQLLVDAVRAFFRGLTYFVSLP